EELQHLPCKPSKVPPFDVSSGEECLHGLDDPKKIPDRRWAVPGQALRAAPRFGERHLVTAHEVVGDGAPLAEWNAAHGIDDVSIERREEPDPVLPRQIPASVGAGPDLGLASCFAPHCRARLVNVNVKALLGELLRARESSNAAAEDRYLLSHGVLPFDQ